MKLYTRRRAVALAASLGLLTAAVTGTLATTNALAAPAKTAAAAPATGMNGAPPSSFHGVNWADPGDNYHSGPVVPSGLSTSDSYAQVFGIAARVIASFRYNLDANTVRLPVNPASVGSASTWWKSYKAAIDAATAQGFRVILSYWDEQSSNDGKVDDMTAWNQMWATLTTTYQHNPLVYFEPMNEPYGYTDAQWIQICATWLGTYTDIPRGRVVISGAGYNDHVTTVGAAPALDGTLLSLHFYGFWASSTTEDAWIDNLLPRLGTYAYRTIIDENGEPMTTGLNYGAHNGNQYTSAFAATTDISRGMGMGLVYWPGLRTGDTYSMETLNANGSLSVTNQSGLAQLKWGYGLGTIPPVNDQPAVPATTSTSSS